MKQSKLLQYARDDAAMKSSEMLSRDHSKKEIKI
jgi:hypothetical protein